MSKLYFKYGAMGCSKTASALMCKFNYEQQGFNVLLLKPVIDTRDIENGEIVVKSRIGLSSPCITFSKEDNLKDLFLNCCKEKFYDIVIVDECQFCTTKQIESLKTLSKYVTILCYGLLTDFKTQLFEGSKRLVELCDSLQELKSVCTCGKKANVNARFVNGVITNTGASVAIENQNNITYKSMCYDCYVKEIKRLKNEIN